MVGETELLSPASAPARPAQDRLIPIVARMPPSVFAVVDGGHLDDVASVLGGSGVLARSLFLGEASRDVQRFGPWLVPIAGAADVATVLSIVGDLPAVVFWSCAGGHDALFHHLRRLNMARIPEWAAAGKTGPERGVAADLAHSSVLFRHWDPSVLGALLPVLDAGQFSRILGPAGELAFHASDYGGTRRVVHDPEWPLAPAGLLTITGEQAAALTDRRVAAKRQRIGRYSAGRDGR